MQVTPSTFAKSRTRNFRGLVGVVTVAMMPAACVPYASVDIRISWAAAILEGEFDASERELREGVPAGEKGLKPLTLKIEAAMASRKARFDALAGLLEKGGLGEGNDGHVHVFEGIEGISAKELEEARALAEQENRDRDRLIREVAEAKSLEGERNLVKIREALAHVMWDQARASWKVQDPDGRWVQRGSESRAR